jgi:hypothetical protein
MMTTMKASYFQVLKIVALYTDQNPVSLCPNI